MMSQASPAPQTRDPAFLRWPIAIVALLACLAMLYVSARLNYRFGYGLATNPEDGILYGMLSAAADILKVVMPFVVLWAAREKMRVVWRVAVAVLICSALYGWAGAAGHFSKNRLETAGEKTLQSENYKDLRAEQARTVEAMKWLGAHRSVDGVKGDIQGLKAKNMRLWTASSECVEPSGGNAREFCQKYFMLNAELGNAQQAEKHQARIDEIAAKLGKVSGGAASSAEGGDAQAGTLSKLTFGLIGVGTMQVILVLLGIACLELGGGFGPFTVFAYLFGIHMHQLALREDAPAKAAPEAAAATPGTLVPVVEAVRPMALLPKPAEAKITPEPQTMLPEWRFILEGLDFFASRKGPLRKGVTRDRIGYHWLAWLMATGRTGEFCADKENDQIARLYDDFCAAAHREQISGINIAKGELRTAADKVKFKKLQTIVVRDSKKPTTWIITPVPPEKLREVLIKRGLLSPSPAAVAGSTKAIAKSEEASEAKEASNVVRGPFGGAAALPAPAANDHAAKPPVRGLAQLTRSMPDLDAQRHWSRMEKTAWKARHGNLRPQHLHRFSRARAAA